MSGKNVRCELISSRVKNDASIEKILHVVRALVGDGHHCRHLLCLSETPYWVEQPSDPRSQEVLGKIAEEINRSGPVMIDQETELMPAVGAPGMLVYSYRLVSYSVTQVGSQQIRGGGKGTIKRGRLQPSRNSGQLSKKRCDLALLLLR